jgi:DNA-binding NarL/FixJ family response regulator
VVLELDLPDQTGFQVLLHLVPLASRPRIAVIVLTTISYESLWGLAKDNGAYACFSKAHTNGNDLDRAIQRAVSLVGQMPWRVAHAVFRLCYWIPVILPFGCLQCSRQIISNH